MYYALSLPHRLRIGVKNHNPAQARAKKPECLPWVLTIAEVRAGYPGLSGFTTSSPAFCMAPGWD